MCWMVALKKAVEKNQLPSFCCIYTLDAGCKLSEQMTFRRHPGSLSTVLCTFNLPPVSWGLLSNLIRLFHLVFSMLTLHMHFSCPSNRNLFLLLVRVMKFWKLSLSFIRIPRIRNQAFPNILKVKISPISWLIQVTYVARFKFLDLLIKPNIHDEKQLFTDVLQNRCSWKFHKFHRKTWVGVSF